MESVVASVEGSVDLSKDRELGFTVDLNSLVSGLVDVEVQQVGHLLGDDADSGACVKEHIDGAGVSCAGKDW